jgi:hypothetical protein
VLRCEELAAQLKTPGALTDASSCHVIRAQLSGDPDVMYADAIALREHSLGNADQTNAGSTMAMTFLLGAFMRGTLDGILEAISANARKRADQPMDRAVEAWALALIGHRDRARSLLAGFDDGGASGAFLVGVWAMLAETAARCGDVEASRTLVELLAPCRDQFATTLTNPIYAVAHATGVAKMCLGELDAAVADLEHAVSIHERMRAPFHIAYSQTALADALARRATETISIVRARLQAARSTSPMSVGTATSFETQARYSSGCPDKARSTSAAG